jgi:hypothetical protein
VPIDHHSTRSPCPVPTTTRDPRRRGLHLRLHGREPPPPPPPSSRAASGRARKVRRHHPHRLPPRPRADDRRPRLPAAASRPSPPAGRGGASRTGARPPRPRRHGCSLLLPLPPSCSCRAPGGPHPRARTEYAGEAGRSHSFVASSE